MDVNILAKVLFVMGHTETFNLLRKNEKQEDILSGYLDYLDQLSKVIEISEEKLKEIDEKGSFKSDDEVGFFFKAVKQLQSILNEFQLRSVK